jgi:cyclohexanecarboxylate-CoA ligase
LARADSTGATTYWTLIADAAQRGSNRPLLTDEYGRSLTTRQLHDAARATAAAFAERGIGAGTVVSWQLPTTLETMVVMAALARLGAVQNPIIPMLREHEVGFITGQLATEFLPERLVIVDSLPRNQFGRVIKKDLRETFG